MKNPDIGTLQCARPNCDPETFGGPVIWLGVFVVIAVASWVLWH
jgi:hypothetical protein